MSRSIELKDLVTFSNIYGLDLTDQDVIHLQAVYSLYAGRTQGTYFYKRTPNGRIVVMEFSQYGLHDGTHGPKVEMHQPPKELINSDVPLFSVGGIYLQTLPKVGDVDNLSELAHAEHTGIWFATVDEFKQHLVKTNFAGFLKNKYTLSEEEVRAMYWTMDKELDESIFAGIKDPAIYEHMPDYVQHIVDVLQLPDDTRIALLLARSGRRWNQGQYSTELRVYSTKPGDPSYNFTDTNHYVSHLTNRNSVNNLQPCIVYTDKNAAFPRDQDSIDKYRNNRAFCVIDPQTLALLTQRWVRKQQDIIDAQESSKRLLTKIKEKITELAESGTFTFNDMVFTEKTLTFEGQVLTDNNVRLVEVLQNFSNYGEEQFNFDQVQIAWVHAIIQFATAHKKTTGKIGDVEYTLEVVRTKTTNTTKAGYSIYTHIYYINGQRINKDEVADMLARAICFPNTEEFTKFCESVAACSLRYHKLLVSGINLNVHDEIFDENISFKISMERENGRNFIIVNGKRWKVLDTNRLLSLLNAQTMTRIISILLDPSIVGIPGEDIKELISVGKKAIVDQKTKEQELLTATLAQFNIRRVENYQLMNGKGVTGYIVHGNLREYLVEETRCLVYEYPSGRYICMVDKGQNEYTNTARLVNRFYALSNDSKLAKEISTL